MSNDVFTTVVATNACVRKAPQGPDIPPHTWLRFSCMVFGFLCLVGNTMQRLATLEANTARIQAETETTVREAQALRAQTAEIEAKKETKQHA